MANFSFNKITIGGALGKDAEHKVIGEGKTVSKFTVATSHSVKDKQGIWQEKTVWHNVVAFNLSKYVQDALIKGAKVIIDGRLDKREYDKDGVKQYITEISTNFEGVVLMDRRRASLGNIIGLILEMKQKFGVIIKQTVNHRKIVIHKKSKSVCCADR